MRASGNEEAAQDEPSTSAAPRAKNLSSSLARERRELARLATCEPYYACATWRREPYEPTPYEALDVGAFVPGVGVEREDAETLLDRFRTSMRDGWTDCAFVRVDGDGSSVGGAWAMGHAGAPRATSMAAPNTSSEATKTPLRLGVDVEERPLWGMDCFTREAIMVCVSAVSHYAGEENRARRVEFLTKRLLPKLHTLGADGWDMSLLAERTREDALAEGDANTVSACEALLRAIRELDDDEALKPKQTKSKKAKVNVDVKEDVETVEAIIDPRELRVRFRLHPKGTGVVCINPNGLKAGTFVNYYNGEIYAPWQWYERQDAIKKCFPAMDLPSFFNITLERPPEDERGRHVIFVEAMHKGSFASRLSHSCEPNCQTVTFAQNGKLSLGMFTTKDIACGEEMTWDYSCITESAEEYRSGFCLCSSPGCRGSFLTYAGSGAFTAVVNKKHAFLHRNAIIYAASTSPLTDGERTALHDAGVRECALEGCPEWLVKWAALTLEYIQLEQRELPEELMNLPATEYGRYDEIGATHEAAGVKSTRLTNLVVTLDKVRYVLSHPGQRRSPFFRRLSDDEIIDHLWSGEQSIFRRFLFTLAGCGNNSRTLAVSKNASIASLVTISWDDIRVNEAMKAIRNAVNLDCKPESSSQARLWILKVREALANVSNKHFHAQARDCLWFYANTHHYFTNEKLDMVISPTVNIDDMTNQLSCRVRSNVPSAFKGKRNLMLQKKYGPLYVWGQLATWYKQTIYAPEASLSADRRGALSLPDPESCYSAPASKYLSVERGSTIKLVRANIHAMWPTTWSWSFKNPTKIYGSPMFDEALRETFPRAYPSTRPFATALEEYERDI